MSAKFCVVFLSLCAFQAVNAGLLGFALQTLVNDATSQIKSVMDNYLNMVTGSGDKADQLLQKLKYKGSNQEGLLGLAKQINMSVSLVIPGQGQVDVTPCIDADKPNVTSIIQKAGQGIQACVSQADKELQPYRNNLRQLLQKSNDFSLQVQSDLSSCIMQLRGVVYCVARATQEIANAKGNFVANSDFQSGAKKIASEFQDCYSKVHDQAIIAALAVVKETRQCIQDKTKSSNSTAPAS